MKLTIDTLNLEYLTWAVTYGADVNLDDFTFVERISSKFETSDIEPSLLKEKDTNSAFINLLRFLHERGE